MSFQQLEEALMSRREGFGPSYERWEILRDAQLVLGVPPLALASHEGYVVSLQCAPHGSLISHAVRDPIWTRIHRLSTGYDALLRAGVQIFPHPGLTRVLTDKVTLKVALDIAAEKVDGVGTTEWSVIQTKEDAAEAIREGYVVKQESSDGGDAVFNTGIGNARRSSEEVKRVKEAMMKVGDLVTASVIPFTFVPHVPRLLCEQYNPMLVKTGEVRVVCCGGLAMYAFHTLPESNNLGDLQTQEVYSLRLPGDVTCVSSSSSEHFWY
jgi:hypothetical protein